MHGDCLFIRENGVFKILAIQLAYECWTKKWHVQDVRRDVSGLNKTSSEQNESGNCCCNGSLVSEMILLIRDLMQGIKAQNEVMSQIMDQNSELISMLQSDDEDDDDKPEYLSE